MTENKIFAIVKQKGGYLFFVVVHPFERKAHLVPDWVLEQLNCKNGQECVEYLSRFSPAEFEPVTDDWTKGVSYNYNGIYVGYDFDNFKWIDYIGNISFNEVAQSEAVKSCFKRIMEIVYSTNENF